MRDLKRISAVACVLIVLLRMSIGWQFFYEGVWKITSLETANPWTAEGYLKNAKGPFRNVFRNMTGDPDDLNWLDVEKVAGRWDAWHARFVQHYGLNDGQKRRLDEMLNGPKAFYARLSELPEGVEFRGSLGRAISFNAERERLEVDGDRHLIPAERDRLLRKVTVEDDPAPENERQNELAKQYVEAVKKIYARSSRLSLKDRLRASLKGDPQRAGFTRTKDGEVLEEVPGEIELYKRKLQEYEKELAKAEQDFQWEHLRKKWNDIQEMRRELVGPVRAMDAELKQEAHKLLTDEQLARGPVPGPLSQMQQIDLLTMWGLTVLGVLLIAGLLSPLAAVCGAGMLISFYLVIPPWTGVPAAPGPEHAFLVNKNFIEALALLAIAALPTGRWFGIDAIFYWLFGGRKAAKAARAQ